MFYLYVTMSQANFPAYTFIFKCYLSFDLPTLKIHLRMYYMTVNHSGYISGLHFMSSIASILGRLIYEI